MTNILIILYRTLISYFFVIILLKFMGKREIGQLSLFDLLILLTIADIMVVSIENFETNFFYSLIPMLFLAVIQRIIAVISLKIKKFRQVIDGDVTLILYNGKFILENMKRERYNLDDFMQQLRITGNANIADIEYAILESSGKLSVFKYGDIDVFPMPLIGSGKIDKNVMKILKIDDAWLLKKLNEKKIASFKDVFLCYYKKGEIMVYLDQFESK